MKRKEKLLRLNKITYTKLMELKTSLNDYNEKIGKAILSENAIIEEAINHYHSVKIGNEIVDHSIEQMSEILGNRLSLIFQNRAEDLANAFNYLFQKQELLSNLLATNLIYEDFPIDDKNVLKDFIEKSVDFRNTFRKTKDTLGEDEN